MAGPQDITEAGLLAQERLRARRRRTWLLRRRVVVSTVVMFVLLFGVIFTQLVTGHDPVLSRTDKSTSGSASGSSNDGFDALFGGGSSNSGAVRTRHS